MRDFVIAWDTDGVLLSGDSKSQATGERKLRPHAQEIIQDLEGKGVTNYVWSRAGKSNAEDAAGRVGLPRSRCFAKPEWSTPFDVAGMSQSPDLVIDDNDGESVLAYSNIVIPTFNGEEDDHILLDIFPQILDYINAKAESRLLDLLKRLSESLHAPAIS
jgi:hypothetical protein